LKEEHAKENEVRGQEMMARMLAKKGGETAEKRKETFQTPAKAKDPLTNI
jgi:hypothetical protein